MLHVCLVSVDLYHSSAVEFKALKFNIWKRFSYLMTKHWLSWKKGMWVYDNSLLSAEHLQKLLSTNTWSLWLFFFLSLQLKCSVFVYVPVSGQKKKAHGGHMMHLKVLEGLLGVAEWRTQLFSAAPYPLPMSASSNIYSTQSTHIPFTSLYEYTIKNDFKSSWFVYHFKCVYFPINCLFTMPCNVQIAVMHSSVKIQSHWRIQARWAWLKWRLFSVIMITMYQCLSSSSLCAWISSLTHRPYSSSTLSKRNTESRIWGSASLP